MTKVELLNFFSENELPFSLVEHPPVFTCEETEELRLDFPGAQTKNLFLRDKKGERHFLVVVGHEKKVDLKAFGAIVGAVKLSFASSDRLSRYLGVNPGAVTVLSIINDREGVVELYIDRAIWEADAICAHPLENDATLIINHNTLDRFLQLCGIVPKILTLPS